MSRRCQLLATLGIIMFGVPASAAAPEAAPSDPAQYAGVIDNPWFPMKPGTTLIYKGTKDEKRADRQFEVTAKSKVIGGVTCIVAEDRVSARNDRAGQKDFLRNETGTADWIGHCRDLCSRRLSLDEGNDQQTVDPGTSRYS